MKRLALLAALALAPSCIAVASRSDEPAPRNPAGERAKLALSLEVHSAKGTTWDVSHHAAADAVEQVLRDSGYFAEIVGSSPGTDLALAVDVALVPSVHEGTVSLLFGLTLGLVPVWATQHVDVSVVATLPAAGERRYSYRGKAVEFGWLPVILASPFFTASDAACALIEDGMADVLRRMVEDGSLPVHAAPRAGG